MARFENAWAELGSTRIACGHTQRPRFTGDDRESGDTVLRDLPPAGRGMAPID
jgi:hypothetical protein